MTVPRVLQARTAVAGLRVHLSAGRAGAAAAVIGVAVFGYLWFRPFAGDLYPNWFAVRAFIHGMPAYVDNGTPLRFIYPPSFLLLFAPLGLLEFPAAKQAFLIVNTAAIVAAALVCLRLFGLSWRSRLAPLLLIGLSLCTGVLVTLIQGNVNGLILLGEAVALLAASRGRWRLFGLFLGLTLSLKPALVPLLILPILWRRWDAIVITAAVVGVPSAAVIAVGADSGRFLSQSIPYMLRGEAGIRLVNTSIAGMVSLLSLPAVIGALLRLLAGVATAAAVWVRFRSGADSTLKIVEISGLVVAATLLVFSFSSEYHVLFLVPLAVSAALPGALMRSPLPWVGLGLAASPHLFVLYRLGARLGWGPALGTLSATLGFAVILGFLVVAVLSSPDRRIGRVDDR
jgi:arabinofuranan 3-O-arabinosyltransferase